MINDAQRKHYETARTYLADRLQNDDKSADKNYVLNRGDILLLVMLIDQEKQATPPAVDIIRLEAIREKLGNMFCDAPMMSKEEAQKFR